MNKLTITATLSCLLFFCELTSADALSIPLQIDYPFIKKMLVKQLYKGEGQTAEVWNDHKGCSFLKLSNPRLDGQKGQIHLLNQVQAQFGTGLGGQCLTLLAWSGTLETFQQPRLESENSILRFPVTQVNAYDDNGKQLAIDKLEDLLKRVAGPKLADLKIDLNDTRVDIQKTLVKFLPQQNVAEIQEVLNSLKFNKVNAGDKAIAVNLAFNAPKQSADNMAAPVFNEAEQKQWAVIWQEWDSFLTKSIDQIAKSKQSPELRDNLTEVLLDSRASFQAAISSQHNDTDPVRSFFTRSWDRLAPELKKLTGDIPNIQGLRYLSLIAATDVMYELEKLSAPFGMNISADGLRRLGRMLIAGKQQQEQNQQPK